MEGFETRPVEELPESVRGSRSGQKAPWMLAFAELPKGLAMFMPCAPGQTPHALYLARISHATKSFRNRAVRSRIDPAKNGVWLWWQFEREEA